MNNITLRCICLSAVLFAVISGCNDDKTSLAAGRVFRNIQLSGVNQKVFYGDTHYITVRSSAVPRLYSEFRKRLSQDGIVKWEEGLDCNHWVTYFIATSQTRYAVESFHNNGPVSTLAMAEFWYVRDKGGAHAVVKMETEKGVKYFEPQNGEWVNLTKTEIESRLLEKW